MIPGTEALLIKNDEWKYVNGTNVYLDDTKERINGNWQTEKQVRHCSLYFSFKTQNSKGNFLFSIFLLPFLYIQGRRTRLSQHNLVLSRFKIHAKLQTPCWPEITVQPRSCKDR